MQGHAGLSMNRRMLLFPIAFWAISTSAGVRGDERTPSREIRLLEQAVQNAIKEAEPAVACILVSRSDVYKKLFQDEPPADEPGKLGGLDSSRFLPPPPPENRRGRFGNVIMSPPDSGVKKYDLADPGYVPEAYGSGVVIDGQQLLVLTNYHVLRGAAKVYVRLAGGKGSYADIHAADPRSDLAVLRLLDGRIGPLKAIRFGDGDAVRKGQFVVALANVFSAGFRDGSPGASWGIVSNVRRRIAASPDKTDERFALHALGILLQVDARLNAGCSGGALLNLKGEMIGLTTAQAALTGSETPGGFAIPMDGSVKRIIGRLREGLEVEYGFLGVQHDNSRPGPGVGVYNISSGSPAFLAGLHEHDRILAVNDVPLHDFDDLVLTVGLQMAGTKARIKRLQLGSKEPDEITAQLAKSYVPGKIIASRKPPAIRGIRVDYSSVLLMRNPFPGGLRFGQTLIPEGVFVFEVQPKSPAAEARLQINDVITHVAGQKVRTPAEFYREAAKVGPTVPLELTLTNAEWHRAATTSTIKIPGAKPPATP
jgi:S1-C subfamily serine protease